MARNGADGSVAEWWLGGMAPATAIIANAISPPYSLGDRPGDNRQQSYSTRHESCEEHTLYGRVKKPSSRY